MSSTALRGERRELLGLPLLLSMRRDLTADELVKMLREELARRFGDAAVATADGGECRIYQAETGRSVSMTDLRLDTAAPDKVLGLHSREYLVVEWEDGPPHQVLEALAEGEYQLDLEDEVPLERCFEWFTESEQLSEYDAVYCSGCKDHRQSFKRLEFWSLPPVLILQLKRFEFTGVQRRRLSTQVRFPLEGLDLGRFCLSDSESFPRGACLRAGRPARVTGLQSAKGSKLNGTTVVVRFFNTQSGRFCANGLGSGDGGGIKLKPENLAPVPRAGERPRAPELVFDLTAISTHIGDARFGHYKAYVRSSEDGHWRCFDDDRVQEVPPDAVEALRSEAYLLFYVRRDHRPRSWGPPPAPACA